MQALYEYTSALLLQSQQASVPAYSHYIYRNRTDKRGSVKKDSVPVILSYTRGYSKVTSLFCSCRYSHYVPVDTVIHIQQ